MRDTPVSRAAAVTKGEGEEAVSHAHDVQIRRSEDSSGEPVGERLDVELSLWRPTEGWEPGQLAGCDRYLDALASLSLDFVEGRIGACEARDRMNERFAMWVGASQAEPGA